MSASDCKNAPVPRRDPGPARGVLPGASLPADALHHARIGASAALADRVQHCWIVRWDLRGQPALTPQTLPHPNVHAVFDDEGAWLYGVHTRRFSRRLEGRGEVFGIKFRPGVAQAIAGVPAARLRNRRVPLPGGDALQRALLARSPDDEAMVGVAEAWLSHTLPAADQRALQAAAIVDAIAADPAITRVEQLLPRWATSLRGLQRLFNEHVGVGAKWTINRYRLHEAIERMASGAPQDWAALALELGYFDQAHFIRDLKAMTGRTPGQLLRGG